MHNLRQSLIYAMYFAPRGRERLLQLGELLAARHLTYKDRLVGIVGDAGSGKSLIIKGMFPGLSLSNDDDTIDSAKIMQVRNDLDGDYSVPTYHLDMRFQMAFTQMFEIVEFVKGALEHKRRVIIEHFDLLYPYLNINADIMIGIGEEIIVTRPNIFGPLPKDIYNLVYHSVQNRKMLHTAEDLTTFVLQTQFDVEPQLYSSDVRGGFVLIFKDKPEINLDDVEREVLKLIDEGLEVSYCDEDHIRIGEEHKQFCTGPRIHVRNTDLIENFQLMKEFRYDRREKAFCLVGMVGDKDFEFDDLNKIRGVR